MPTLEPIDHADETTRIASELDRGTWCPSKCDTDYLRATAIELKSLRQAEKSVMDNAPVFTMDAFDALRRAANGGGS